MIKIGKIYTSKSGERFLILARKNRPSSNGYDYIGENTRSGLVTYFNTIGEHSVCEDWNLKADPYKWLGMCGIQPKASEFVPREQLVGLDEFTGLLRIENDDATSIQFRSKSDFEATYA